jgi:hypothetical protein
MTSSSDIPFFEFETVWSANWGSLGSYDQHESVILVSAETQADLYQWNGSLADSDKVVFCVKLITSRGKTVCRRLGSVLVEKNLSSYQKNLIIKAGWQQNWTNFRALFTKIG